MARNVFLAFVVEDKDLVELFRGQAKNANNQLEFSDYSVKEPFDSTNAQYIRSEISDLINRVSVTVCIIGRTTYQSSWVDWEIRKSVDLNKGIVGVRLHSSYEDVPPQALKNSGAHIVNWAIYDVVSAIETAARRAGY
jgi:hypothetical protein